MYMSFILRDLKGQIREERTGQEKRTVLDPVLIGLLKNLPSQSDHSASDYVG